MERSGIGRACCARLAEAGATVVVADIDEEAARETASAIGSRAIAAAVDVREAASVRALVERALAEQERLDVWVNAAGIYPTSPLLELSEEDWDLVLDTNLRGTFLGAQEAARAMIAGDEGGVIVNVSSTAAYRAEAPGRRALRRVEVRRARTHAGARGRARPPRHPRARGRSDGDADSRPRGSSGRRCESAGFALEELGPQLPLGRVAVPDDIARVVLFCACDLSLLMTGSTLLVDAGELVYARSSSRAW